MDDDQAATVDPTPPADPGPAPTSGAPWGINPRTGTAYKRDPRFFEHLRGSRTATRRGKKTAAPAAAGPAVKPAPARRTGKPEYAKRIVEVGRLGLMLVHDPVDRAIVEMQLPVVAVAVEKCAMHYQWLADILDRVLLAGGGLGPATDLIFAVGTGAGLIALNHGNTHPVLIAMFGATLQQLQVQALQQQQATNDQAEQLRAMLAQAGPVDQAAA